MTMVTKEQAEALIERLADKTIDFGCEVISSKWSHQSREMITHTYHSPEPRNYQFECSGRKDYLQRHEIESVLGHPIMLTDVLEKMSKMGILYEVEDEEAYGYKEEVAYGYIVLHLWGECSFTKSLQDILAEVEWELVDNMCSNHEFIDGCEYCPDHRRMKGPAADLFRYLSSLFPET